MKKIIKLIPIFILLIIDILIKRLVLTHIKKGATINIIRNFFYLTNIKNTGAAFNILENNLIFLVAISLITTIILLFYFSKNKSQNKLEHISLVLIIPGIIGNLIDRIFYKGIIDYLGFTIFKYNAPIFNFADTLIVVGALLFGISIFIGEKNENKSRTKSTNN